MEKHNVSRLSYLFTHLHLLSSYSFSSTLLSSNLSLLSASSLLCFSSVHIVGNLTSKLPSTRKELACAVRQPGLCVRALCEAVAVLLSKNMTCARPRRNATSRKHFPHTSHCTLHTSHLSSFHLVYVFPYVSYVLLGYFHVI